MYRLFFNREGKDRGESIEVTYHIVRINDIQDNFESFAIKRDFEQKNTYLESKVFKEFDGRLWNFKELEFFCNNNRICLRVYDQSNTTIREIGMCQGVPESKGDFNNDFDNDFFI